MPNMLIDQDEMKTQYLQEVILPALQTFLEENGYARLSPSKTSSLTEKMLTHFGRLHKERYQMPPTRADKLAEMHKALADGSNVELLKGLANDFYAKMAA